MLFVEFEAVFDNDVIHTLFAESQFVDCGCRWTSCLQRMLKCSLELRLAFEVMLVNPLLTADQPHL